VSSRADLENGIVENGHLRVALVTAAAAIGAALVVGIAGCLGTERAISGELRRDEKREGRQGVGAARLLMTELLTPIGYMNIVSGLRTYDPLPANYGIDVSQEDMRLVFSQLSTNEFGAVMFGLIGAEAFERAFRSDLRAGERRPSVRALRGARFNLQLAKTAYRKLERVAEAEDLDLSEALDG
jgi:hypothetical protein